MPHPTLAAAAHGGVQGWRDALRSRGQGAGRHASHPTPHPTPPHPTKHPTTPHHSTTPPLPTTPPPHPSPPHPNSHRTRMRIGRHLPPPLPAGDPRPLYCLGGVPSRGGGTRKLVSCRAGRPRGPLPPPSHAHGQGAAGSPCLCSGPGSLPACRLHCVNRVQTNAPWL